MDNALPTTSSGPSAAELQAQSAFGRLVNRLADGAAVLAGVAIVAVLVLVCIEVLLRPFRISLLIVDEVCGYLNASAVFLGLAYTLRDGGFIRVELVYDRFKGGLKRVVQWSIVLSALLYTAVLLYYTVVHVRYLYDRNIKAVSVIETPEWIPQSFAIVGLLVLLLQLVVYIVHRMRHVP